MLLPMKLLRPHPLQTPSCVESHASVSGDFTRDTRRPTDVPGKVNHVTQPNTSGPREVGVLN